MTMVAHTCLAVISSLAAAQAQVSYYIGKDTVIVGESVLVNTSDNFDSGGNEYPISWISTPYDVDDDFPSWRNDPYYTWRYPGSYLRDFNHFTGGGNSVFVTFTRPGRHYVDLRFGNLGEQPMPGVNSTTPGGETRKQTVSIAVAAPYDYESFDKMPLASKWVATGMTALSGPAFVPTWYSVVPESPGKLAIHTYNDSAKPLHYNNTHPTLLAPIRNIQSNYAPIIQTEFEVTNVDGGSHFTGLYLEAEENGTTVKYAFGVQADGTLAAKRSAGGAFVDIPNFPAGDLPPVTTGKIRLRIAYGGFHKGVDFYAGTSRMGHWHYCARHQIAPQPVVFTKGGVFLSTSSAQHARVLFDNFVQVTEYANNFEQDVLRNTLRITEIMYHPKSPDSVEYIELQNVSPTTRINLKDASFTKGVALTFGDENLEPLETGVVTNNRAAFQAMYPNVRVLGEYHGNLNDDGEEIQLMDPSMLTIHRFSYNDVSPWPTAADGGGSVIEVINWNPANYNNASNWRVTGAYPGAGPDTDGDGTPDSHEAIFGTSPTNPNSKPVITAVPNPSGHMVITWPCINGGLYIVEYCSNLGEPWAVVPGSIPPDVVALIGTSGSPGNPGSMSYTDTSVTGTTQRFYRVRGY